MFRPLSDCRLPSAHPRGICPRVFLSRLSGLYGYLFASDCYWQAFILGKACDPTECEPILSEQRWMPQCLYLDVHEVRLGAGATPCRRFAYYYLLQRRTGSLWPRGWAYLHSHCRIDLPEDLGGS